MPENPTFEQLFKLVTKLLSKVAKLLSEVKKLTKENTVLKKKLAKYENPKNSCNSSVPPSKDENRPKRTNSLRKKTTRKSGGQKGHKGNTLRMTDNADIIKEIVPDYCCQCGENLTHIEKDFSGRRQVIDIPPVTPIYTEYQIYSKQCTCGHETTGSYPENVNAAISYGANIMSFVAYFHARQFVPFYRMKEMINHLFGLSISEGGIDQMLEHFHKKVIGFYNKIIATIEQSTTVGGDETGCTVGGKKYWIWTWVTKAMTVIVASTNRGKRTIEAIFPNGFPRATLVSDCWTSHLNTPAKTHQICTAHLLRELKYLTQLYKNNWSKRFAKLLRDAIFLEKNMTLQDYDNSEFEERKKILQRFELLLIDYKEKDELKELNTFVRRMVKLKNYVFVFLFDPHVPPDNNASERAVRNVKVKQKVSGQFKSENGAQRFAVIRSVIDTLIKNEVNILDTLKTLANSVPKTY